MSEMQQQRNNGLGKRVVACKGGRWMPGMVDGVSLVVIEVQGWRVCASRNRPALP